MKKVSEWFMELPEPYRSQALRNLNLRQDSKDCPSLEKALSWGVSPEEADEKLRIEWVIQKILC